MKILMLADVFFPDTIGGAGRVAYHLSLELSRKGHEVHVITRRVNQTLPSSEKLRADLIVHRFSTPPRESMGLILSEIKNSYALARALSQELSFDLACLHQSLVALGPLASGIMKGLPRIYYWHSPWHEEFLIKHTTSTGKIPIRYRAIACLMKRAEKRILGRSHRMITLSRYMAVKLAEHHECPADRMVNIPGGVELDRFTLPEGGKERAKRERRFPLDKTIFLTVRNLVPRMGLENLVEAFHLSEILRHKGLLLIGGEGFLKQGLQKRAQEYQLEDVVRFLGHIPDQDLPQLYQAADYFVLPTLKLEGFGLVILEAMACGTPALGTPVGAIPETIGAFSKKLLFKGTDWRDLREKLEQVIQAPQTYTFDPESCRAFVEKTYSWTNAADRFLELAEQLLSSPTE